MTIAKHRASFKLSREEFFFSRSCLLSLSLSLSLSLPLFLSLSLSLSLSSSYWQAHLFIEFNYAVPCSFVSAYIYGKSHAYAVSACRESEATCAKRTADIFTPSLRHPPLALSCSLSLSLSPLPRSGSRSLLTHLYFISDFCIFSFLSFFFATNIGIDLSRLLSFLFLFFLQNLFSFLFHFPFIFNYFI
ncbi:unnamed protein product [Acanthosepion pharaonis]|uniref:Transmembrane protein n=1 Tax=Acanthosepion pharaonis TaxID=158019 RepID=A0A812EI51_ACAPH|nr:unnamed protein product [Sepia pharaonis]